MTLRRLVLLAALPLLLAACDGGGDPVQQALLETSSKNQSATVVEGEVSGPPDQTRQPTAAGEPTVAGSEAESQKSETAARDAIRDQAYVAKMIAHHENAVALAEATLGESRDPEIRRMARSAIDARTREIAELRTWRAAGAS